MDEAHQATLQSSWQLAQARQRRSCERCWHKGDQRVGKAIGTRTYKVAITKANIEKMIKMLYRPIPSTIFSRTRSRSSSKPDDRTAFPRAIPPIAKNTIDQWKEWKSSYAMYEWHIELLLHRHTPWTRSRFRKRR